MQADAAPPSSEHVGLVGEPVADQPNAADVAVVLDCGVEVSDTVGAVGDGVVVGVDTVQV